MTDVNTAADAGPTRLLMIDDDEKLCRLVSDYLEPFGYEVSAVHDGLVGEERVREGEWDAVILDVMLPGADGFEVLKRIRTHSDVPVLMLTARGDDTDRIVGLEVGADDYLPKTFSTRELLARLRAVLRRAQRAPTPPAEETGDAPLIELTVGELVVQPEARRVLLRGELLDLTPVEFDLLQSLVRSKGRVKSRELLLDEVRERNYDVFDRSIDVHISALRRKLGDNARSPRFIRTLRSAGYLFIDPARD